MVVTHIACTLLAENIAGQPIACMQYGSQPHPDQDVYSNIGHMFTFKKHNFIISARDGVKPVIKRENSAKSGNVGISALCLEKLTYMHHHV